MEVREGSRWLGTGVMHMTTGHVLVQISVSRQRTRTYSSNLTAQVFRRESQPVTGPFSLVLIICQPRTLALGMDASSEGRDKL
jgi:hypothetical protein